MKIFFLLGLLLDVLALLYFYFTDHFSRLEYYVFYIFHVVLAGLSLFSTIFLQPKETSCLIKDTFMGTALFINLIFVASGFVVMFCNLYIGLKYAHLGSNIVWSFMWLEGSQCHHFLITFVGFTHALISLLGLISFVLMSLLRKTEATAKCWRKFYGISLLAMLFCYLLVLLGLPSTHNCPQTTLFAETYKYFGIIEMLSPILLLMFLNTEFGDPRRSFLKKDANIFEKERENMNF